ncbi:dihydroxyacetone kinase subunit L [Anaerolineaceae bacterium oral taxon 439]|nr:dihydroxyacetone kinase subunit L [Anaerolineaceae bacterium oral taxon 439]
MDYFLNSDGKKILTRIIGAIQENKEYLSEIDGRIGDGDHGINMNKGFSIFEERIRDRDVAFSDGLGELGEILLTEIGGSMGPIYGTIFCGMAERCEGAEKIDLTLYAEMLRRGLEDLSEIIEAKVGDKTIVDTLAPAVEAVERSVNQGEPIDRAMASMISAAEQGKESTRDMVARVGRSSRLGERSKGVLDAGAVSCFLIIEAMGQGIQDLCL